MRSHSRDSGITIEVASGPKGDGTPRRQANGKEQNNMQIRTNAGIENAGFDLQTVTKSTNCNSKYI